MKPCSSTPVREASTLTINSVQVVAAATNMKINMADKIQVTSASATDASIHRGSGGNTTWTVHEKTSLVKHMQNVFKPAFDAPEIFSLLPAKSEECIEQKWRELSSALLVGLSKRKHEEVDELNDCSRCVDKRITPPQKKMLSSEEWAEADLERLNEIMLEVATAPKWDTIANQFPGRTPVDCLTQWQSMSISTQVKGKGSWTPAEDFILSAKCTIFGNKWSKIAEFLPGRSGKQCRERFVNHLDPNLKKTCWSDDEEAILIGMHHHQGNKWTHISKNLPGRSDNDVKNHWYSTITRKFQVHGKDKLTLAAIQQVFMLVTAGIVGQDLVRDWPGAPTTQACQYWYGHGMSPDGYPMPLPYPKQGNKWEQNPYKD